VAAVQAFGLRDLLIPGAVAVGPLLQTARVLRGDPLATEEVDLAERDEEALEIPHQSAPNGEPDPPREAPATRRC
jgi:hypothetical protein